MTHRARRVAQGDPVALAFGVFLDHNLVGAVGQGGAGRDANRCSRLDGLVERMPRCGFAGQRQGHRIAAEIPGTNRITIHRRGVKGGLGQLRLDRRREDAPGRLGEADRLGVERTELAAHACNRLKQRDHGVRSPVPSPVPSPVVAGSPAAVARCQSPDLPPLLVSSWRSVMRMPLSSALAMS